MTLPQVLFPIGHLFVSPLAAAALGLAKSRVEPFIDRHISGDWAGMLTIEQHDNIQAVANGDKVTSSYPIGPDTSERIVIVTNAERTRTAVHLAGEDTALIPALVLACAPD